MSKFSQLAQRIKSLPNIEEERKRIAIVQRISLDAKGVGVQLGIIFKQAPHIDALTRGGMVSVINETISFSVNQAISLKKLIQRDDFGSEKKISDHLDNLKNKMQVAEKKRTDLWVRVQAKVASVETILQIAEAVKLESVQTLKHAVTTYKQATALPPSSLSERDEVLSALERNNTAIANSGLTGNVKKILDGAIVANGDPRLLLKEDVQKFLKDHPALWGSLKLKLA